MLNIVIPMAGNNRFDNDDYYYPKPFIEIAGKPMIEWVIKCYENIPDKRFIFIVNQSDCIQFYLDKVLQLLTGDTSTIIPLSKPTQGAACSAMLAIDLIEPDQPLIIANGDHVIRHPLEKVCQAFKQKDLDAGLICFDSIHPKWSYARVEDERIVETAEKCPISRNAIAGFYYFKHGGDFMRAAMDSIAKQSNSEGPFYVAPVLNEMVLWGRKMGIYQIGADHYHHFYSPGKLNDFEQAMERENPA